MERGHEKSNSSKTIKICLGKNLSMEFKDNKAKVLSSFYDPI